MDPLFELPEEQAPKPAAPTRPQDARVRRPVRDQVELLPRVLDSTLPEDHRARAIWSFLEKLDLSAFYASIKAVVSRPGHPATDPQVLLGLWLLATVDGIGSARRLARLCDEHDAYRWLRGGVPINYHMLSDFRVAQREALDELLSEILASMMSAGLVTLRHVAQDGMRVRASAGKGTFRREARLRQFLEEAREQVKRLAKEAERPDPGVSRKQQAARERAAREREGRLEEALRNLPEVMAAKERKMKNGSKAEKAKIKEPRVSTTDAQARVMKMPEGGFQPAYNLQIATDVDSPVIVGVFATRQGSDGGQAVPMVEQVVRRTERRPKGYLMDGGFAKHEDIRCIEGQGIAVYAPVQLPKEGASEKSVASRLSRETPEVARWRARMETDGAKKIYRERAATAECVNAQGRAHGLTQLVVRGTPKVMSVLLIVAITHNLLRWISLTS
jgi:transposase